MSRPALKRRLIVNADDFGRSAPVNEAVVRAHREGILTTASLMVNEPGFTEAVQVAHENPRLGVGLHVTLLCGRAALSRAEIPGLVDADGNFTNNAVQAGFRYFFRPALKSQLRAEIVEQFRRFHATGLKLDHVNGHLHLHLHPVVLSIIAQEAINLGVRQMRLTFDPLLVNLRIAQGVWLYRLSHWMVFGALSLCARPGLRRLGIRHTTSVFGLLQNGRVNEDYVCRLLPRLPAGDSELYSHPCVLDFRPEFDALISARVREQTARLGIELIRYQDL